MALGEVIKILLNKDHVGSSVNGFCERIKGITYTSFTVASLN